MICLLGCIVQKPLLYTNDPGNLLSYNSLSIFFIPLDSVTVQYFDNTKLVPDTQFSDSFFTEAANSLIKYVCKKNFTLHADLMSTDELQSTITQVFRHRFSNFGKEDQSYDSVSLYMKMISTTLGTDLVLFPYLCQIKHITFQPKGWRQAPNYQRPVKYIAFAEVHLQIWDNQGNLIHEIISKDDTGRPILYSFFKKDKPKEDVVSYAKNYFAPPLVRALSKAINNTMPFNR